jgi:hypothetical protein
MKKICLFILIFFAACKKQSDRDPIPVNIQVTDATTGQPVSGAVISLRRCANAGCAWGSVEEFGGTTDNNGICQVPPDNYNNTSNGNDAIFVGKKNYQTPSFPKSTTLSIKPYGWLAVKITRASNYPQGAQLIFLVETTGQSN